MSNKISTLLLQKGKELKLSNGLIAFHPTIDEIFDFEEQNFKILIDLFCSRPYDYMVQLEDSGLDWQQVDSYSLFIMVYDHGHHNELLKWLFKKDVNFQKVESGSGEVYLYDIKNDIIFDKEPYEEISCFLSMMNFLKRKPDENPGNIFAKELLMKQKRRELKRAMNRQGDEKDSELSNFISFLVWNNSSGMGYDEVFGLKVFQFYEGVQRLIKTDRYKNIMQGYYTGNISGKDIKFDAINWFGKLNID
jgi:hypothetical protein